MNTTNILIVDDVAENLRLLSGMLKESGHQIRPVTNGSLALQAARQMPPDLILLDIKMPGMDGFEVCRKLKSCEELKDIPVIFISALNETEDKLKAFQAGGVDYVTKPFQIEEVQARVRTHLDLRRQKIQLEENFRQLQQLEKLRDSLTHMIVHDMRSPLMSIGGYLEMIEMFDADDLSSEAKDYVTQARVNVSRLIRMANEMLTVSKLEAGRLELNRVPCDLARLISEVVAGTDAASGRKQIQFPPPAGDFRVLADVEILQRVLQNLFNNAVKFSPPTEPIRVSLTRQGDCIRVEVADGGPGIPPGQEGKIFEKFGQLDRSSQRSGTGLGLAFCKLALEAHGGDIGVNSVAGQGSNFWFVLDAAATVAGSAVASGARERL